MNFALIRERYGPFMEGSSYYSTEEGRDWIKCKRDGKLYYLFKNVVDPNPFDSLLTQRGDRRYEK